MIILLNDVMFFILHLIGLCLCTVNMLSFWSCVFNHGICELSGAHHALLYPLKKSRPVYASPIHSDLYLFLFSSPSISLALPFSLFTGKSCPNYCQHGHFGICTIREFRFFIHLLHVHDIMRQPGHCRSSTWSDQCPCRVCGEWVWHLFLLFINVVSFIILHSPYNRIQWLMAFHKLTR